MWAVNRGSIDVLEHGVLKSYLLHGPAIDQASTLERPPNGGMLFHHQDVNATFGKNRGQSGADRPGSNHDDVVVHALNPGDGPHEACASFLLRKAVPDLLSFVQVQDGGEGIALLGNQVRKGSNLAFCDQRGCFFARQFALGQFAGNLNLAS